MTLGSKLTLNNVILAVLASLLIIQVVSWLLNELFGFRLLQLGNLLVLFLVFMVVAGVAVNIVIARQFQLERRDVLGVVLVAVIVGFLVFFLPKVAPQIFSSGGISDLSFALQSVVQ